jgi:hypothetical protein
MKLLLLLVLMGSCQEVFEVAEGVGQIPRELGRHALGIEDSSDGQDGVNGSNGRDGNDGQNGSDGVDGQDGSNGQNGQDGVDGQDGQTDEQRMERLEGLVEELIDEVIRLEEDKQDKKKGKGKK